MRLARPNQLNPPVFCRPSRVLFEATGFDSPIPKQWINWRCLTFLLTSQSLTASALR